MAFFSLLHIIPSSKPSTGPVRKPHSHLVLVATDNGANVQHHLGCNRNGVDPEGLTINLFIPFRPSSSERWDWTYLPPYGCSGGQPSHTGDQP